MRRVQTFTYEKRPLKKTYTNDKREMNRMRHESSLDSLSPSYLYESKDVSTKMESKDMSRV